MDIGIAYIALDSVSYLGMTLMSISSLRLAGNEEPVCIITNIPDCLWSGQEELSYKPVQLTSFATKGMRSVAYIKSHIEELSPYNSTLLLDADILILGSLESIWSGTAPVAVAIDACGSISIVRKACPLWGTQEAWAATIDMVGEEAQHFNIGVLRIDKSATARTFLREWRMQIERFAPPDVDEIAFIRALHVCKTQVDILKSSFNCSYRRFHDDQVHVDNPVIVHFNAVPRHLRDTLMLDVFRASFE